MRDKIEKIFDFIWEYNDLAGIAVGVYSGDADICGEAPLVYEAARGYSNFDTKEPLTESSVFHCASVSKLFTATAIMQLVEAGKINLDDKLLDLIPELREKVRDERFAEITIRNLITHTSGLPDVYEFNWDQHRTDDKALEDYVYSQEVTDSVVFGNLGADFEYSDMGYNILGYVVSRYGGDIFEEYVRKNILDPVGMTNSTFLGEKAADARPHTKSDGSPMWNKPVNSIVIEPNYPYTRQHAPSSTLKSTVGDLLLWGREILAGGEKLLTGETLEEMLKPQAKAIIWDAEVGLGWFMQKHKGLMTYGHEGGDDGFKSKFLICPELDAVIVVLSNMRTAPAVTLCNRILDCLIDKKYTCDKSVE